ncbi:MAG: protein-L-isoaspartate(D-aspartate) O-methyltransferase [Desulfitobacteriaceae bacterium]
MSKNLHKAINDDQRLAERVRMVENQLVEKGIQDEAVLESMRLVPRHRFVLEDMEQFAYESKPLPITHGQTISQPYIVALMAQALELKKDDKVLEIGTGSGYSAAVLSRIINKVYTIERHAELALKAEACFRDLDYLNIEIKVGDGTKGWPERSPFNAILVTAGGPEIPASLTAQLAPGGRLVIPVGLRKKQELIRIRCKEYGEYSRENLGQVCFVPLIGKEGWSEK